MQETTASIVLLLKRELRQARESIEELEVLAGLSLLQPPARPDVHLKPMQAQLAGLLLTRGVNKIVTRDMIHAYIYGNRIEADKPATHSSIDVLMCQLRKLCKAHGATIELAYGQGWYLTKENAVRLTEITSHLRVEDRRGRLRKITAEPEVA